MSEVFNADVLDAINRALSAENVVTREGEEPVYCNVNNETREIEIPGEITIFGVEHDENAVRVFFKCPKIIGDNVDIDITKSMVYIIYINAGGEKDQYIVTDVNETEDGDVTFSWLINRKPAKYQGITQFGIRVIKSKTGGEIENEWNTTVANANILNGVETEDIELSGDNIDVVNQLLDLTKQEIELTKQNSMEEIEQKGQETLETIPSDYTTAAQNALSAKNEVEDIRVGADGTTYTSAGEAVRSQSGFMSEQVTSISAATSDAAPQIQSFGDIPINKGALLWKAKYETFTDVDENTKQIINIYDYLWFMPKLTLMVSERQLIMNVKTIKDVAYTNVVPIIAFIDPTRILLFEYVKDSNTNYLKYRTSVSFESDKQLKKQGMYADAKVVGDSIRGLQDSIENLESLVGSHEIPVDLPLIGDTSPVYYTVSEDAVDNVFGVSLFMDAYINARYSTLFGEDGRDVGFHKEMKKRYIIPQVPADEFESNKEETEETLPVYTVGFNEIAPIVQKYRGVKINKSIYPKILIIGDSVGDGYGATTNRITTDGPSSYDTWVDYFFRINGQTCKTLNIGTINGNRYGSVKSYKLSGETIRAGSISKGGWSLEDLNLEYFEQTSNKNPFYDPSTQKFSLKHAVNHFKTLSDDGETRLIVGETAGDMVTDVNAFDFCAPTHVVISLTHNTSLSEYQNNIAGIISTIRSEYPNIKIILMVMDESATFFIDDYKNYAKDSVSTPGYLHTRIVSIYQYIKENIENESNNVFLLSANLTQPTAEGFPTKVLPYAYNLTSDEKMHVKTNEVSGPSYHPNNLTHASFGYQIYSIVQWTMS